MSECNFYVGQKVVLVDDKWPVRTYGHLITRPTKGPVYTVRSVEISLVAERGGARPCLLLEEIINDKFLVSTPTGRRWSEPTFDYARFSPVKVTRTDISIFKAMLNPSKEQVTV